MEIAASRPSSGRKVEGEELVGADNDRLWGLSFRVRDADAARGRLMDTGFDVSEVRDGRKPGTRVLTVRDGTCGVPTLILQPAPPRDDRLG